MPALGWSQSTDRSEIDQWIKASANQGDLPIGTKITMANWQQYKQFMPVGMQKLWEGKYYWKLPSDAEMDVGPTHYGYVTKGWANATEKYSGQNQVEVLPNGHFVLKNYHGGVPFPNAQEPYKGWKILANVFFAYAPSMYVKTPDNDGTIWALDHYGTINATALDVVYRWSSYNTDPGFPETATYAPGTWFTEYLMEESPEQARYTASLNLFYIDQEAHPYPDTFVFVPALRRSLRLASTARCSPVFGWDWTYDDAKFNGFNGSTSIYTGDFLGDRKILTMVTGDFAQSADFPGNYFMTAAFPKPSWGKWEARNMAIDDVHRIPSEASGYCYSSRIVYADRELWGAEWVDLFDSNKKLWKSISYYNTVGEVPGLGKSWNEIPSSQAIDFQNQHMTIWSSYGNPHKRAAYINQQAPKEFMDGVRYGSPSGLQMIMR
ncbi:MAG: DUF1329 domain-containing protein [Candidatus Binataceae bacterium]